MVGIVVPIDDRLLLGRTDGLHLPEAFGQLVLWSARKPSEAEGLVR